MCEAVKITLKKNVNDTQMIEMWHGDGFYAVVHEEMFDANQKLSDALDEGETVEVLLTVI